MSFFIPSNHCELKSFLDYMTRRPKTTWRSWKVCWTVVTTSLKSRYQILRGVLCCGPDIVDHCWISIKRFNNPAGPAQLLKTSQVSLIVWVAATCFLPFRQYIIVWLRLKSSEYLENVMKIAKDQVWDVEKRKQRFLTGFQSHTRIHRMLDFHPLRKCIHPFQTYCRI